MASPFATVSKDEILPVNEVATPTPMPRNRQNLACRCLLVDKKNFLSEFTTKSLKMIPETLLIKT